MDTSGDLIGSDTFWKSLDFSGNVKILDFHDNTSNYNNTSNDNTSNAKNTTTTSSTTTTSATTTAIVCFSGSLDRVVFVLEGELGDSCFLLDLLRFFQI